MGKRKKYHWSTKFGNALLVLSLFVTVAGVLLMVYAFSSIGETETDGSGKASALAEAMILPLNFFTTAFSIFIAGLIVSFLPPRFVETENGRNEPIEE